MNDLCLSDQENQDPTGPNRPRIELYHKPSVCHAVDQACVISSPQGFPLHMDG